MDRRNENWLYICAIDEPSQSSGLHSIPNARSLGGIGLIKIDLDAAIGNVYPRTTG